MRSTQEQRASAVKSPLWLMLVIVFILSIQGQQSGNVTTIGGAFEGYVEGDNQVSQFRTPLGLAVDGSGMLYIADYGNNAIRAMRLNGNVVSTFARVNGPSGIVLDAATNLYITSVSGGTVLLIDSFGNLRKTVASGLDQPTAITIDRAANLYVAERGGRVRRMNTNGVVTGTYRINGGQLTGVAVLGDGRVIVADAAAHVLWAFVAPETTASLFAGTPGSPGFADGAPGVARFHSPHQIARGPNNSIVVADRLNHRVRVSGCDGVTRTLFGVAPNRWETFPSPGIFPGWLDGSAEFAESREPVGVAVSAAGTVYDTEVYYHLVRAATGVTFPSSSCGENVPNPILSPNGGFYPNGTQLTVTADNLIQRFPPDVRLYYTINGTEPSTNSSQIPVVNGQGQIFLPGPVDLGQLRVKAINSEGQESSTASGTGAALPALRLSTESGYYPMGFQVAVTSDNGFPAGTRLFYTLNGSEPTTNSIPLNLEGNRALIRVQDATVDLSGLRVKAFVGNAASATVGGKAFNHQDPTVMGNVGIPPTLTGGPILAGVGGTVVIPVVANLRDGQSLRSLQYVVEVVASDAAPRLEDPAHLRLLPISSNDFVQVVAASTNLPQTFFNIRSNVFRLAVPYVGTNASFAVNNYAVVGMLGLTIPTTDSRGMQAREGRTYTIRVNNISATSDGSQNSVRLEAMPPQTIEIRNVPFVVGDTSPGYWYNAGTFGDQVNTADLTQVLNNSDVNNAVFASFGLRVPYRFTDVFAAMDAYPRDSLQDGIPRAGGDGEIRFLDWVTIFQRSVGFDNMIWRRQRTLTGAFEALPPLIRQSAATVQRQSISKESDQIWNREAVIYAASVERVPQTATVKVPVYLKVDFGKRIAGMQFVCRVEGESNAPEINGVRFVPSSGISQPFLNGSTVPGGGTLPNVVYCAWQLLLPELTGTVLLGNLEFVVPTAAPSGSKYTLRFEYPNGAGYSEGDELEEFIFESRRGAVWVNAAGGERSDGLPDEWKMHFFGALSSAEGAPEADPDNDGFSNAEEYLAGTHPKESNWRWRKDASYFYIRFVGKTGEHYTVERSPDLSIWTAIATRVPGRDALEEIKDSTLRVSRQFYRIKRDP